MVRARRDTITYSKTTFGALCLLVAMVIAYLYFLNMSVVQVVMRTEYTQQQRELSADIALLESSYIEAQHKVAARIGDLEGYESDAPKMFVSRAQASLVLGAR